MAEVCLPSSPFPFLPASHFPGSRETMSLQAARSLEQALVCAGVAAPATAPPLDAPGVAADLRLFARFLVGDAGPDELNFYVHVCH